MSEETESCTLSIEATVDEIHISGISDEVIVIGYEGDIELTDFVTCLSKRIDSGHPIELDRPEDQEDAKLNIILDTIFKIIEEYNASIEQAEEVVNLEEAPDFADFEDEEPPF
jgi:hypothetical protein